MNKAAVKQAEAVAQREAEAQAKAKADYEASEQRRLAALAASCAAGGSKHTRAAAEARAGRHQQAFEILYDCRNNLSDAPVKALFVSSMTLARKETEAQAMRVAAAAKAAKKKLGVTLGMSQQDVLDSSWGRPDHVNRTTTARGTREQWVYGSGNYLYFEDGVLTAIQN